MNTPEIQLDFRSENISSVHHHFQREVQHPIGFSAPAFRPPCAKDSVSRGALRAYMDDGLWLKNATNANTMATRLGSGFERIPGASLVHPVEGKGVFACLPDSVVDAIVMCGCRFQRDWRHEPRHHRFVCSRATTAEQVDELRVKARLAATSARSVVS